jgi:hypothetical protein
MATEDLFPGMTVTTTHYKEVNGHGIEVGIMVPKELKPGKHPIIVRFHGGFLVCTIFYCIHIQLYILISLQVTGGHSIWFQKWLVEYAKLHSAVIVGVDYRLMPEHNGLEMMEDVADVWDWILSGKLQAYLGSEVEVDLDKILIEGDSAGKFYNPDIH